MENAHRLQRRSKWALRVAIAGAGAALALLVLASPAAANVTFLPAPTTQGDAANLTFRISDDSTTASINRIEIRFADDQPIAEVYPLSADNWAPQITTRRVAKPLQSLHGGASVTDPTTGVIWTAMPGRALKPGQSVDLTVAAGPLPNTPQLVVGVILTRSDGVVERWTRAPGATSATADERPAIVIGLAPASGGAPAAVHDHGDAAGAQPTGVAAPANSGGNADGNSPYIKWVLVVLVLLAGLTGLSLVRQRRIPAAPDTDEKADEEKELVSNPS
jgi:Domain of unkown function (DUF1775)